MSQENVEIVRAFFEAWNAGDMDAFRELYDPDVIVRTVEDWPEPGPYVGREAVMRFFEQLRDTWDADAMEPISDFIDAGDRVAVRYVWRGAGHGPETDMELTVVFTMRKGKIVYQEFFWDHARGPRSRGAVGARRSRRQTPEFPVESANIVEPNRQAQGRVAGRTGPVSEVRFDGTAIAPPLPELREALPNVRRVLV